MYSTGYRLNTLGARLATLLGSASLLTLANATAAQAQMGQMAQAEEVPENVLITGSLIRGAAAVGVPVTNLSPQDFAMTGALTTADLFRTIPTANVSPGPVATQSGANIERATKVNIRGLDSGTATRSLLMIDGVRAPAQGNGLCEIDPSIIPALSQDRIDVLVDGASATYGSDAIGGVINIILKRAYDGAVTQLRYSAAPGGKNRYLASQLWGRTWDGGDITLSYEWYDDSPIMGNAHSNLTINYSPWGNDNRTPVNSSMPGTITAGAPFVLLPPQANGSPNLLGTTANLGTVCQNCFAIPHGTGGNFVPGTGGVGPTSPYSASTLNWATFGVAANGGTNGTRNEFNPYSIAWYDAAQQRNGGAITVDQRLTKDIKFVGEAFYSNRRAEYLNPSHLSPSSNNDLLVGIPTFNPYYPTGGAPTNLRVGYNMAFENPSFTSAYELAHRYMMGLEIQLPYGWVANLYYAQTYDSSFNHVGGAVNKNAISAALGWTIPTTAASGTTPAIATWTKPSNVPYLNLFCDATQFACNSPTTLSYVTAIRSFREQFWINEKGLRADGPLFDLPAGTVKAAIGGIYQSNHFNFVTFDSTGTNTLLAPMLVDPESRGIWAGFAQLNVPIFGENFSFPLFRKFELEASWRHDQYSDVGGTSNQKVGFNWTLSEDAGFTVHGTWGTSFRAPVFGEISPLANVAFALWNANDLQQQTADIVSHCGNTGSGAARLADATGCAADNSIKPVGISMNGGSAPSIAAGLRNFVNTEVFNVNPEKSTNWGIGAEFAPSGGFLAPLQGLDLQATYYIVKITGRLVGFGNPTTNSWNDPTRGFSYIVPTDLKAIDPAGCSCNATPTACSEFEQMIIGLLNNGRNSVPLSALTRIQWINDGGTMNKGWQKTDGIDWSASYDFDTGFGAFNAGIVGTYYLHQKQQSVDGDVITDSFHTTVASGGVNESDGTVGGNPRMKYRGRLGWSNGSWNVTGFVDYQGHIFHTQTAPPNVNAQCLATGGTQGGGTFPCLIQGYTNLEPSWYTFDLSMGYDTGDNPANEYLRNIGVQLVIQNIFDKHPAYEYRVSTGGGNPVAFDLSKSNQGRTISVIVTKTW
jgi:iron complex outermembrane receptor protein